MNTGGFASNMELLDWMAGQALEGLLACPVGSGRAVENAASAYDYATAMLAEKARREADHSPDATKMALDCAKIEFIPNATKQPDACALLRRFIDAVPDGFETSLLWDLRLEAIALLDRVTDHSPDADKMAALESANRELVRALEALVGDNAATALRFNRSEDSLGRVGGTWGSDAELKARAILAKHKGAK